MAESAQPTLYRLSWEMVGQRSLRLFCNARRTPQSPRYDRRERPMTTEFAAFVECDHDWQYFAGMSGDGSIREGVECVQCGAVDE